jgi:hypothetical protein
MQLRSPSASLLPRIIDELTATYDERNGRENARPTDLLEDYDYGYCTDGHSDVDHRSWHSVVLAKLSVWPRV